MRLKIWKPTSESKDKKYVKKTDYEKLGRLMYEVYEKGYFNKWRMYRFSFLKGIASGFGGVIGATIVVALVIWLLSFFESIPLIDRFVEQIENSVNPIQ